MRYLLDTNVFVNAGKSLDFQNHLNKRFGIFELAHDLRHSVVTSAELMSINLGSPIGPRRIAREKFFLEMSAEVLLTETMKKIYAEIDCYSLSKLKGRMPKDGARQMGKNDLWIAATAVELQAELITCDKDFLHLDDEFLTVHYVDANEVIFG